jgi:hypothetical protein
VILDTGFLIAVDRGEAAARSLLTALHRGKVPLHTTHPVVAQVWRSGGRQARLAAFLKTLVVHPFDDGRAVGALLAESGTADVVDAHLVLVAARHHLDVLTGDPDDLSRVAGALAPRGPLVRAWPDPAPGPAGPLTLSRGARG